MMRQRCVLLQRGAVKDGSKVVRSSGAAIGAEMEEGAVAVALANFNRVLGDLELELVSLVSYSR